MRSINEESSAAGPTERPSFLKIRIMPGSKAGQADGLVIFKTVSDTTIHHPARLAGLRHPFPLNTLIGTHAG